MKDRFTKNNFKKITKEILEFQLKTLYPIKPIMEKRRLDHVFLNHDRNFSTFLTIKYCVEHERVADIYALSRVMFESIINMGLLAISIIPDDLDRYENHQFVDVYKTYNHLKKMDLEKFSGLKNDEITEVESKRNNYINKYGNSSDNWSGKSLETRVKIVDENYPVTCNENRFYEYLYCQVYRKGSQLTHSSFGGLSTSVNTEIIKLSKNLIAQRFVANDPQLIFSCFHSLIVFLSSVRFLSGLLNLTEPEEYYQKITRYIIEGI
jgi:hypothetical protein